MVFSLPSPYTIPLTNRISITDPLEMDGTTQPGYTGQPVVVISRTSSTESLYFDDCASNLVKGIRFSDSGGGVLFLYGGDSRVENCWFVSNNVGIYLHNSPSNTIGGGADYRNVFLYCGTATYIDGTNSSGNSVSGNYIGLYPSGEVGGNRNGVEIFAGSENTIGGTGASMRNLFAGHQTAVYIAATNNMVIGNWIGLDPSGTGAAENTNDASYGIYISQEASNTIGAINHPNYIAGNGGCGINLFFAGTGNSISDNRIYDNGSLGISFNNGTPTANDAGDADTGSNNQQNYPVLNSATSDGTRIYFSGTLDSLPSTQFRIEIFGSRGGDTSGYGEGERRLTYFYTTTDAGGRRLSPMTALSAERRPITSAPPPRATTGSPRTPRNSVTGSSSIPTETDWATASKWSTSAVMPVRFPMPTATATASPTTGSLRPTPVPRMQAITHTSAASNGLPTSSSVCPARSTASTRSRDVPTSMPEAPGR